jgi:hypothetical protein
MTIERAQQLQLDLIALRAQEDRLVTEAVLRRDWDAAASLAARSARITEAIERMLTTGRPYPSDAAGEEPGAGRVPAPVAGKKAGGRS